MTAKVTRAVAFLLLILTAGCGSDTFLFPMRKDVSDLEIKTLASGRVLFPGEGLPVEIVAEDSERNRSLDLLITVFTPQGAKVWENRLTAAVTNEPLPAVQLPDLQTGQYRLELSLSSAGSEVQKKSVVFFASKEKLRIAGIKSFPAGITVSSTVLLKAEIEAPAAVDPYLRWSWRGKTIADGFAGKGFKNILWSAPGDEGVYTIALEVFPTIPIDVADIPFKSSLTMSTDIYVSAGKTLLPLELGPDASYYALYHFRAGLQESGAAEKKPARIDAVSIGAPEVVATDYGFGYRLNGGAGILIPGPVLPPGAGTKKPFTVNLSVRLEASAGGVRLLHIASEDGGLSFAFRTAEETMIPELVVSIPDNPAFTVSSDALMEKDKRHLLSVSVVPLADGGFSVQWFIDGEQTAHALASFPFPQLSDGNTVIGGTDEFTGTVDEFGVYTRDEKGKDSPDPALYRREAERTGGESVVLAEGFDGISLASGFAARGSDSPVAPVLGTLSLPPAVSLELPPLKTGDAAIDFEIGLDGTSAQEAVLTLRYKGEEQNGLETRISARGGSIQFSLQKDRLSFDGPDGAKRFAIAAPEKPEDLIVTITNPNGAKSPLRIDELLAARQKE